jgi:hypothetical protein
MATLVLLALAVVLVAPAAPRGKAKARPRIDTQATVIDRTKERAYFDRGSDGGFVEGAKIEVFHAGRSEGTCVLEHASEHHAQCVDEGRFQLKDSARLVSLGSKKEEALEKARAPDAPHPGQRKSERAAPEIAAAPIEKVAFERTSVISSAVALRPPSVEASASAGYQVWSSAGQVNSSYQVSNADVLVRHVPLYAGFGASLDVSALGWTVRPPEERFRPGTAGQIYVFEASVEQREVGRGYVASVGRIRPWHAPGLVALDGGQAGWRSNDGSIEIGGLAGGLPDLSTLAPSTDRWTAGAYWSASIPLSEPIMFRQDGRLALVSINGSGGHGEGEATAHAIFGRTFDLGAGARIGFAGSTVSGVALDSVRADVGATPIPGLRITGGYRERRNALPDLDPAASAIPGYAPIASRHADGMVSYDFAPWVTVALLGGYAQQIDGDGRSRGFVGPEVTFPGALGRLGSIAVGYQEERGWLDGRTGYAQTAFFPTESLSTLFRLSYMEDTADGNATAREIGLFARASYAIGSRLSLSALVLARAGLTDADLSIGNGPIGVTARLALSGAL